MYDQLATYQNMLADKLRPYKMSSGALKLQQIYC